MHTALQKDNPLRRPGLTIPQSLLFFEAAAHHLLAIPTCFMVMVPLVYTLTEYSPLSCPHLWEFAALFCSYYGVNRVMLWWAHRGCEGGDQEMWRGTQMWVSAV